MYLKDTHLQIDEKRAVPENKFKKSFIRQTIRTFLEACDGG